MPRPVRKPLALLLALLIGLLPMQVVWAFVASCESEAVQTDVTLPSHADGQPDSSGMQDCPDCQPDGSSHQCCSSGHCTGGLVMLLDHLPNTLSPIAGDASAHPYTSRYAGLAGNDLFRPPRH